MPYQPTPGGSPTHIQIAGVTATPLVRIANLTITDVLNEQPNTAALTVAQLPHLAPSAPFDPPSFYATAFVTTPTSITYPAIRRGQPIAIYSGGLSADQVVFAGEIVTVQQYYELSRPNEPSHVAYHLQCTDHTRALIRRKVTKSYLTQSATAIAQDLIATYTSGFSSAGIEANLPAIAIDFTFEEMNRALTRLANRIGGYWYVDYDRIVHFFLTEAGSLPAPLVPGAAFSDLTFENDLSQVRTRVTVEGAGTTVSSRINPGETMIPVRAIDMLPVTGGTVRVEQALITYTGVVAGGAGALVGTGAQPSAAPTATPIAGAGIESGVHQYAVTFVTATGESLPSPRASATVGQIAPPAAPQPSLPTPGTGPSPGIHYYAATFVTAAGETPPSAVGSAVVTTQVGGVPTPGATTAAFGQAVGNLANGSTYRYQTTITTASGETLPGASSAALTVAPPAAPTSAIPGAHPAALGGGTMAPGSYVYYVSYVLVVGGVAYETPLGPKSPVFTLPAGNTGFQFDTVPVSPDARVQQRYLYRSHVNDVNPTTVYLTETIPFNTPGGWNDKWSDSPSGPRAVTSPAVGTPPGDQARVTLATSADARATGRKVYRSDNGTAFRLLTTVANMTTTEVLDNVASVAAQPVAPTSDTTGGAYTCVVAVSGILPGPAQVTARRLYRTAADVAPGPLTLRLIATIANNTQTTYTDTLTDASLGATAPTTNTTGAQQVAITNAPIGGAGVIDRKLYRTAANATTLQFLGSFGNNTTTTTTDSFSDTLLGAAAPIADTSGLQQPQGQVNAGATVLPVSGTSAFVPAGGFAVLGNGEQVIRYTGVTATSLTGIPATGDGAINSTVAYNASVTVAPTITGVPASGAGSLTRALIAGQDLNLLTIRNDVSAQTVLAAIEGGDGVIEHYIQDRRLSPSGAAATAEAELGLFATPEIRVRYATRDPATRSGKTVTVNLPAPTDLVGEFLIQRVHLTQFDLPGVAPLRQVEASSTRFSFEDVLRRLQLEIDA